jgi:hypothetical protein
MESCLFMRGLFFQQEFVEIVNTCGVQKRAEKKAHGFFFRIFLSRPCDSLPMRCAAVSINSFAVADLFALILFCLPTEPAKSPLIPNQLKFLSACLPQKRLRAEFCGSHCLFPACRLRYGRKLHASGNSREPGE